MYILDDVQATFVKSTFVKVSCCESDVLVQLFKSVFVRRNYDNRRNQETN